MEGKKPLWTEGALRKNAPAAGRKWKTASCWPPGAAVCTGFREGAPLKRGLVTPSGVEKTEYRAGKGFSHGIFYPGPAHHLLLPELPDEWENKRPGTCPGAFCPARPELYFVFLEEAFRSWAACAWAFSAISLTPMPLRSAPSWA